MYTRRHGVPATSGRQAQASIPASMLIRPFIEDLKKRARELGLWNMFLPKNHFKEGAGFSNLEYGLDGGVPRQERRCF